MIITFRNFPGYYGTYDNFGNGDVGGYRFTAFMEECYQQIVWSYEKSNLRRNNNDLISLQQYEQIKLHLKEHFPSIELECYLYYKGLTDQDNRVMLGIKSFKSEADEAFFLMWSSDGIEI